MIRTRVSIILGGLLAIGYLILLNPGPSFSGTVALPQTGQTTCYDIDGNEIPCQGTGQDGDIQAGVAWPEPRFTDNGNGTVTDNLTGLMWLKDANCFGAMTWQEALNKVADLNANPENYTCGGYTVQYNDWVLPNINQLESLLNAGVSEPCTWLNGKGFINVQLENYWTSTTYGNFHDTGWCINMYNGLMNRTAKWSSRYVWPVRIETSGPAQVWQTGQTNCYDRNGDEVPCAGTGQDGDIQAGVAWPEPRFTDNEDGTVMDNLTGLMWLKDAGCFGSMTWQEALDRVADLNANPENYTCGGYNQLYDDWRLPNRKEIHSLTHFGAYDPAIQDTSPFVNVESLPYWSSSTLKMNTSYAWRLNMTIGSVSHDDKWDTFPLWPVRAGDTPVPVTVDVKANGSDGPLLVHPGEPVNISVHLNPGHMNGVEADWFFGLVSSYGTFPLLFFEAPLSGIGPTTLINTAWPVGWYIFLFALDDVPGGAFEPEWYDLLILASWPETGPAERAPDVDTAP